MQVEDGLKNNKYICLPSGAEREEREPVCYITSEISHANSYLERNKIGTGDGNYGSRIWW